MSVTLYWECCKGFLRDFWALKELPASVGTHIPSNVPHLARPENQRGYGRSNSFCVFSCQAVAPVLVLSAKAHPAGRFNIRLLGSKGGIGKGESCLQLLGWRTATFSSP
jgi:hypothetical protein